MILDKPSAPYLAMAEFHDLFMEHPWDRLTSRVNDAFRRLSSDAVIVDLGAGSGVGTRRLARQTAARIVALEPDLVMRSVLLARVSDDPSLATRVSVVAGSVPDDLHLLPARIDGFVCMHMLGHLSAIERLDLFTWVEAHLHPDGVGLVTVRGEKQETADAANEVVETRRIGVHEYRAIHRSHADPDTYSSRYEVWDGAVLVRAAEFAGAWRSVSLADLREELEGTGLQLDELGPGLVAMTKATLA